ncbi:MULTISPECIES: TetR/AcrR family transcriptional regulator [Paenibacillus]|uniref:TetR family transcriptional regulator n=1 Tax=Paenibacillus borealis TaxID=160799 RepID=A0ABX3HRB1_PAEBO|nr:TetR/AcrR family transcriptional regulator [Paenibacillus borealis]OMD52536.1 TetR family transcriptional regulator [Paenibacillus borealis]
MEDKKTEIFNNGKAIFSTKGFKQTNVSDITKAAGIAVGTFYNYFSSKEKLFLEIFLEENVKLKKSIMKSIDLNEEPLPLIKKLIALNINGMNSNPILKEWFNKDVFFKIEQQYREENGVEQVDFLYDSFAELFRSWQAEGKIRNDLDVELIMAFFTGIIIIDTHKDEIGIQHFPQIMDYMAEFVMKGLTDHPQAKPM